jgi:hypothetical protein
MLPTFLSAIARVRCFRWTGAYVKCHPADRLILGNFSLLHQFQLQCLVVERDCDNNTRRRPCADHKMVFDHRVSSRRDVSLGCRFARIGFDAEILPRLFHYHQEIATRLEPGVSNVPSSKPRAGHELGDASITG